MPEFLTGAHDEPAARARERRPEVGPALLRAGLVVLAGLVLGALGGVAWELLWTPPTGAAWQGKWLPDAEGAVHVVDATIWFVAVGLVYGLVYGIGAGLLSRGYELVTLAAVTVGSLLAARVTLWVGRALGPADADAAAANMGDLEPLRGSLDLPAASTGWWPAAFGSSALLAPAIAALGCLVVLWLGGPRRRGSRRRSGVGAAGKPE